MHRDGEALTVTVFAPAPQLTITVEQRTEAGDDIHLHAGGQGIWIARLLTRLGVPTTLCASFGGEAGVVLRSLVQQEAIREVIAVEVKAVNGAYVHDRRGGERREVAEQTAGPLDRHDRDELYTATVASGLHSRMCVLGGYDPTSKVIPPDFYRRLAGDLRGNGATVVADLSGDLREAAMAGGLDVLKTSHEDLVNDSLLTDASDQEDTVLAMRELTERSDITHLVVTRAEEPALALSGGRLIEVSGPRLEVQDHRGAGDSVTAGITAGLFFGDPFVDALRMGVAAATLNVARHGLATGRADAIAAVLDQVEVRTLEDPC
ncbi:MAG: PfkB family carbohydrate kinase [Acidimicrobiales bacterium]